jgi:hypothetical protein
MDQGLITIEKENSLQQLLENLQLKIRN